MKKYKLALVVFIFGFFVFNINFSNAFESGCSSASGFSITTGNSCSGCNSTSGYNFLTGASCAPTPPPSTCNSQGIDTSTGFLCGCTSTSGFSTTTGESCNQNPVTPTTTPISTSIHTTTPFTAPSLASTCSVVGILRMGSSGDEVSCLQKWLGLLADGKFGPKTQTAVFDFQGKAGLTTDGIVGPQTIKVLKNK